MNKIKLFTHTDLDGIGCAILAYLAFGQDNVDVEFCDYKDIDAKVGEFASMALDRNYDNVFITDISVNNENANYLMKAPEYLIQKWRLLDHHATALELNKYDWCDVVLTEHDLVEMKTSGTKLFYNYLINKGYFDKYNKRVKTNIVRFARVVRDYDTWRWKEELGEDGVVCKQLNDLFHIYGRDEFIEWAMENILELDQVPYFLEKDRALLEQKQKDIDIYVETKNKQLTAFQDNFGYTCGVVFADRYISELGNRLSELHPALDYIAMIDISRGTVSYRTIRDDIDLGGTIAHSFGGGGHRKAAGSTFDAGKMRGLVLNEVFELKNEII